MESFPKNKNKKIYGFCRATSVVTSAYAVNSSAHDMYVFILGLDPIISCAVRCVTPPKQNKTKQSTLGGPTSGRRAGSGSPSRLRSLSQPFQKPPPPLGKRTRAATEVCIVVFFLCSRLMAHTIGYIDDVPGYIASGKRSRAATEVRAIVFYIAS